MGNPAMAVTVDMSVRSDDFEALLSRVLYQCCWLPSADRTVFAEPVRAIGN